VSVDPWLDRPEGHGPAEWRSCMCVSQAWQALGTQACRMDIVQACAGLEGAVQGNGGHVCVFQAWQALGVWPRRAEILQGCEGLGAWPGGDHECLWIPTHKGSSEGDHGVSGVGVWGSTVLTGQRSRAGVSEIPQLVEQQLQEPMGQVLACSASCSVSKLWHGEAFHELGVQCAEDSALPCALPQPSVSPASQQCLWLTELTQSVAVSQLPSWILSPKLITLKCKIFQSHK
jgi:hypothetical protein